MRKQRPDCFRFRIRVGPRSLRGAPWKNMFWMLPGGMASSYRVSAEPITRVPDQGFRLARSTEAT